LILEQPYEVVIVLLLSIIYSYSCYTI